MIGPGALADELEGLPVVVERVLARTGEAPVQSYPGGLRPTTIVEISGAGHSGFGECVAFTAEAQRDFQTRAAHLLAPGSMRVGTAIERTAEPFDRAALEGALIDLALKQGRLSLADLSGARSARLRWVCSFAATGAPHEHMRRLRQEDGGVEFKVDVGQGWSDSTVAELTGESGLVILDFKDGGAPELCARLAQALPRVIFEDPPPGCTQAQIALDRPLLALEHVERAVAAGRAVNVKAPRLGGFLKALRALEIAQRQGALAYFGGMFEIGPGREQARQLAALFCPNAPNDLAPFAGGRSALSGPSPSIVGLDSVGFGATFDWASLAAADLG